MRKRRRKKTYICCSFLLCSCNNTADLGPHSSSDITISQNNLSLLLLAERFEKLRKRLDGNR